MTRTELLDQLKAFPSRAEKSLSDVSSLVAMRRLADQFRKNVVVIGQAQQVIAHIDMCVTPLGQDRVAVADSQAGAKLARELACASPAVLETFEQNCQRDFFGRADVSDGNPTRNRPTICTERVRLKREEACLDSGREIGQGYAMMTLLILD